MAEVTLCDVCGIRPAVRRGGCWGCYAKFRRAGLLDEVGERGDEATRFSPSESLVDRLRAAVARLSPSSRRTLHEATRPTTDGVAAGRVVRRG